MIKGFNTYIKESIKGGTTVEVRPDGISIQPDVRTRANQINTDRVGPGQTGSSPNHWGSTKMSFGANPKLLKKGKIKMTNVVKSYQSFTRHKQKLSEQAVVNSTGASTSQDEQRIVTDIINLDKQIQQLNASKIAKTEELNKLRQQKTDQIAAAQAQPQPNPPLP